MAAALAEQREFRAEKLKVQLYEALVKEDGGLFLARTGSLIRGSTLRRDNRGRFRTIIQTFQESDGQRFWTKRLVSDSLKSMVKDYKLQLPILPGFDFDAWLKTQTDLIHGLSKKARRNSKRPSKSTSMDGQPTMPYNVENRDLPFGFIFEVYAATCNRLEIIFMIIRTNATP